jgi:hypothetical protein
MKKLLQFLFVVAFISLLAGQETPKKDSPEPVQKFYKVSYLIYELENGKKINERSYTLPTGGEGAKTRDSWIKVGTRVPVTLKDNQTSYLDVGLNIDCNVGEQADKFIVYTDLEITSFAMPQQGTDIPASGGNPVLRSVRQHFATPVTPGKPGLVTSMDDINSKRRLQVEVTVSRLD